MTREEYKRMMRGDIIAPTKLNFLALPNKAVATPVNEFNEGVPRPLTQQDYNAIPLADLESMSKLRDMDNLHKLDVLAGQHKRGKQLSAIAKVQGRQKFAQNYNLSLTD